MCRPAIAPGRGIASAAKPSTKLSTHGRWNASLRSQCRRGQSPAQVDRMNSRRVRVTRIASSMRSGLAPRAGRGEGHRSSDRLSLGRGSSSTPNPERPGLAVVAHAHAVDELAELWRRDGYDVVVFVGKPLARCVAILHRREHRAEEQREAIGILMDRPDRLATRSVGSRLIRPMTSDH